jgi:adenylate cyclase
LASDIENASSNAIKSARLGLRQIGWVRTILTLAALLAALVLTRFSWATPLFVDAERAMFDFRQVQTAPKVVQDDRVVLIPYTDQTLINTGVRSPLDRAILAKTLLRLDKMGAKAIGIDILIDQTQPEDQELIEAFKTLQTPTFLAYVTNRDASEKILYEQQVFLDDFQKQISTTNVKPASILNHTDEDNVLRRWGKIVPNNPPRIPNAMVPGRSDFEAYTGSIAFLRPATLERPIFTSIPIDSIADDAMASGPVADLFKQQIEGRYVLIGGNIVDIDIFQTPLSRFRGANESSVMWGMETFAHMIVQILDGRAFKAIPSSILWGTSFFVILMGAFTAGAAFSPLLSAVAVIAQIGAIVATPFAFAAQGWDTYQLPAFGWLTGWFFGFMIISAAARSLGTEQRRFAQSALGKYLPRDIAAAILKDPDSLSLRGEKREIFVVFTDLEGFTKLSHAIEPEMVAILLNRYLEMLSDVVLDHGGTIDKFVGDAVVAFWGAPISRDDDGNRAAKAAIAMYEAGEEFRRTVPEGVPAIGRTRVGLHHGEAIIGNFGGEGRIQYTALGDSMNTAARLEAANKKLGTKILVSEDAMELSGLDLFRPMGCIALRGRSTPISVFEPVPHWSKEELDRFTKTANQAISGDVTALTALRTESAMNREDTALANLVYRLEHSNDGGYFVLD